MPANTEITSLAEHVAFDIRAEIGAASIGIVPVAPYSLAVGAAHWNHVDLTWVAGSYGPPNSNMTEHGYHVIFRSPDSVTWEKIGYAGPGGTSYTDSSVNPSSSYYYKIHYFADGAYSLASQTINATTAAMPSTPGAVSSLTAPTVSGTKATLTWANPVYGDTVVFQISTDNSNFSPCGSAAPNALTMEITGLSPTTTYFVQARFVNDGVYGEWSPSVTFYTTGAAPCKIRLVFSNTDSFPMSYLSGWGTATGYAKIYHSNGSNTEYLQSSYNSYYPATDNGVYYIDVVPCDSNGTESFSEYFSSMSLNSVGYLIGVVFSEGDGDFANLTYVQIVNCPYLTSVNAAALHNFASGSLLLSSNYNLNEVLLPADFKPYSFSVYQCPLATNMQAVVEHIDSRAGLGRGALDFQNVPYFYSSFAGYIDMWSTAYEYDVAYNTNM